MNVPKLEADLGIEVYASKSRGIGGTIKHKPEEFIVEEVLTDGSKASVQPSDKTIPPSERGRYLVCILIKKGWDTFAAVRKVAHQIGISPDRINVAGIKDARALTAQHVSIWGVPVERLQRVDLKGIVITPIRFSSEKISSRLLLGNQFNIIVRSIGYGQATVQKRIQEACVELTTLGGIPNFFGHQRFGTIRSASHCVGRLLVKGSFEEAALVFLSEPSRYENPAAKEARRFLRETRDFKSALRMFPRNLVYERVMLVRLSKHPRDFLGAFRRAPSSLRLFLVQAYQSFLFNRFLSERMRRGISISRAQIGDYVVDLDERGLPAKSFRKAEESSISKIEQKIEGRKMTVAIPLVGFRQLPSDGVQGEIEEEILERELTTPDDFRLQKMPEASAAGGLRTALAPVCNLGIEVKDQPADQDGLNASFHFLLHKGSYATILLREFMKPRDLVRAGF